MELVKKIYGIVQNDPLVVQFVTFCIVGVFGVIFNYSIFFVLYYFFKVYYILSSATGFILAIFLAFYLNKKFTFKIQDNSKSKTMFIKYVPVTIFSLLLGIICLTIFVELLHINVYIANIMTLGVTTISNFTGSKLFAFR